MPKNYLKDNFFVLNAERIDAGETIKSFRPKIINKSYKAIIAGKITKSPELYGIIKQKGGKVLGIVEKPKKGKEPSRIRVVGMYYLNKDFFETYKKIKENIYSFEKALSLYAQKNKVGLVIVKKEALPLKYPWHLFDIEKYLFDKFLEKKIDKSFRRKKNVVIEGKVFIGKNVKVFENAVIKGPCYVGPNSVIGNNALIRDYTNIEEDCVIGANAEVARCIFQNNIHVHSGFFGDSIFDTGCRIGAGTITANVRFDRGEIKSEVKGERINTGKKFFGVAVGKNSKIGVRASLMPGIFIGSESTIGPGSLVTKNVPDKTVFYTKLRKIKKKK
jgi:bifunctional UDP-N-acetylglucosamine pyrophosphorylase/glucosamine-1-phosphate N-acetyltransferase